MSGTPPESSDPQRSAKLDYESALHARLPPSDSLGGEDDESFGCALFMVSLLVTAIGLLFGISRDLHPLKVSIVLGSAGAGIGIYLAVRYRRWRLLRGMTIGFVLTAAFALLVFILWTVMMKSFP